MESRRLAALALLTTAAILGGCGLIGPVAPAGAVPLVISVQNDGLQPARLAVARPGELGAVVGVAQPDTVPPRTTLQVRFLLPPTGDWAIWANGGELIGTSDLRGRLGVRGDIGISIDANGEPGWWCTGNCP